MSRDAREFAADWLIVGGAVALLVALFLPWSHQISAAYRAEWGGSGLLDGVPSDPTGWQVYSIADALLAALAVALLAVALAGRRGLRLVVLVAAGIAAAFVVHAASLPPTNIPEALSSIPNAARSGSGETVALAGLGAAIAGLLLSFTAD